MMSVLPLVPWLSSLSEGCHTVGWIVFPLTTQTQSTAVHSVHFEREEQIERVIERYCRQILFLKLFCKNDLNALNALHYVLQCL